MYLYVYVLKESMIIQKEKAKKKEVIGQDSDRPNVPAEKRY
jgi:hypothetical protein